MEICCDIQKMVRHPDLKEPYDAYQPPADVIEALSAIDREVTVAIVFGFWCPDSLRIVPEVLKSITESGNAKLQVLAASVPLDETDDLPLNVGPVSVRKFPTVAFLKGRYETSQEIPEDVEQLARFVEESLDASRLGF